MSEFTIEEIRIISPDDWRYTLTPRPPQGDGTLRYGYAKTRCPDGRARHISQWFSKALIDDRGEAFVIEMLRQAALTDAENHYRLEPEEGG